MLGLRRTIRIPRDSKIRLTCSMQCRCQGRFIAANRLQKNRGLAGGDSDRLLLANHVTSPALTDYPRDNPEHSRDADCRSTIEHDGVEHLLWRRLLARIHGQQEPSDAQQRSNGCRCRGCRVHRRYVPSSRSRAFRTDQYDANDTAPGRMVEWSGAESSAWRRHLRRDAMGEAVRLAAAYQ
jgi:hypothetical protein